MTRKICLLLSVLIVSALTACGAAPSSSAAQSSSQPAVSEAASAAERLPESSGAPAAAAPADLPADPFALAAAVDGKVIALPCRAEEAAAPEFALDESLADTALDSGAATSVTVYTGVSGEDDFPNCYTLTVYGAGDAVRQSAVRCITLEARCLTGQAVFAAGGIAMGCSPDEVKAVFPRTPDYEAGDEESCCLFFYQAEGDKTSGMTQFFFENGALVKISVSTAD